MNAFYIAELAIFDCHHTASFCRDLCVLCCYASMMCVCMGLHRLSAISRLPTVRSSASALQFSRRTLCSSNHSSLTNCCTRSSKAFLVLCAKRQSLCGVVKFDASWPKVTWQCGFHTTPRRNIPPVLWVIIRPLAKAASILTGR